MADGAITRGGTGGVGTFPIQWRHLNFFFLCRGHQEGKMCF